MFKAVKMMAHIALFKLALGVFLFELGVGLQYNPTYGTLLWIAAALIATGNICWIMRADRR